VILLSYTTALDAGKAINPCQVEVQTHGGLVQAIGWTLTENLVQRKGRLLSNDLTTYLIPTSVDVPEHIKVILLETADPLGPFGARGIGELPMLTVAPAILAAIRDACGAWLDQVPVLAEDVWRKLRAMKP
jgi:CO/xanthine dehydrogenase Mo-binding subunit